MTEPAQSGGDAPAAEQKPETPAIGTNQSFGTFSTTRGSGLARGKAKRNPSPAAASGSPTITADYKPTALEVIIPEREYRNPFGDNSEPAPTPPPATQIPVAAEEKTEVPAVAEVQIPSVPEPVTPPAAIEEADSAAELPAKAELNILPQADSKRPPVSWESAPSPAARDTERRRDDRPTFRPEPRQDQRAAVRDPKPEAREFRNEPREPRREHEHREVATAPAPQKPRGFFAWLKSLFSGKPAQQAPAPEVRRDEQGFQRDGNHRRRRRGGRGRHFSDRGGDRQGQPQGQGGNEARFQGGERHGDDQGGQRHRRHRGGRGRGRGDHGGQGGHGGGYRSEGKQGGGAI